MADSTISVIIDYLRKHKYSRAATALREEAYARRQKSTSPTSPSLSSGDAADADVDLYLQLHLQNLGSPHGSFSEGDGASGEVASASNMESMYSHPRGPPIVTHLPESLATWANGASSFVEPPPSSSGVVSLSDVSILATSDPTSAALSSPKAQGTEGLESELPRLPPVRLRSIDKDLDAVKQMGGAGGEEGRREGENLAERPATDSVRVCSPSDGGSGGGGVVTLGPVVVGSGYGQTLSSESLGNRRPRGSVSEGIVEVDEVTSNVTSDRPLRAVSEGAGGGGGGGGGEEEALVGGTESGRDFSTGNDWDSDAYEDEDDVGYVRQPIEDEEWFLTNEIEYPSDDERARNSRQVAKGGGGGESVPSPTSVEEEVYFSGEEYYQDQGERRRMGGSGNGNSGVGGGEEEGRGEGSNALVDDTRAKERRRRAQGGSTWEGLLEQVNQHRQDSNEGEGEGEGGEEEEDDQLLDGARSIGARSIGVTGSDIAEAGSSMRESVLGGSSEGDGDSSKGGVGGGASSGLLGRRGRMSLPTVSRKEGQGEGGGEGEGEGEGEYAGSAGRGSDSKEGREDYVGEPEGLGYRGDWPQKGSKKEGISHLEGENGNFGPSSRNGGASGGGGFGFGGFGGFSFPSPSSGGEALSRMDSGRSMWSVGEQMPERSTNEDGDELGSSVLSGPDDTLASWKRKSGGSSPILSPRQNVEYVDDGGSFCGDGDEWMGSSLEDAEREVQKLMKKAEKNASEVSGNDRLRVLRQGKGESLGDLEEMKGVDPELESILQPDIGLKNSGGSTDERRVEEDEEVVSAEGLLPGEVVEFGIIMPDSDITEIPQKYEGEYREVLREGVETTKDLAEEEVGTVKEVKNVVSDQDGNQKSKAERSGGQDRARHRPRHDDDEFETFNLKVIHRKNRTGFEEEKDFPVVINSLIAGRYHVTEYLGSAAFSKAIQAHDLQTGMDVCMKIIKNNKDFFDQSLDEVKLLKYINKHDPGDKHHILRLYDYFYHREHLFIVCELLRANLYEFHKYNRESGGEVYFTMARLQSITKQCLEALRFMHSLGLIHCDLKPENILVKSYSRCEVKVIDLGSSCFETDHLCSYVQSRSYRAPEVILGLPYGQKIDIWSLGCILAELCSGQVLFQNDSLATLLARVVGILGPIDPIILSRGRDTHKYFTKNQMLYERNPESDQLEYLIPKKTSLKHRLPMGDPGFIDFVECLLQVNPEKRPTALEALDHPWLSCPYEPITA